MPSSPIFSVVVPVFNAGEFLRTTLDSVFTQTCRDFELIVVDDGSTDHCLDFLEHTSDSRLRVLHQANQGPASATNAALAVARGAYVALLDHDDLWLPTKLQRHLEYFIRYPDVDLTFTWSKQIDGAGRDLGIPSHPWRGRIDFPELFTDFVIGNSSAIAIRRDALERCGRLDPDLRRYYDMDLVLRVALLRSGNCMAVPEHLTCYRRYPGQMSSDWSTMRGEWTRLLEKVRGYAPGQWSLAALADSNMHRYFAWLTIEQHKFTTALPLLLHSFRRSPARFVADKRNWMVGAACLGGMMLPLRYYQFLLKKGASLRSGGAGPAEE